MSMSKTWSDIFREFKESTGISEDLIADYRPAQRPYFEVDTTVAGIIVWLKDGSRIIYIPKKGE